MIEERVARNRLLLYSLARLCGVAIFALGVAIIYTNLVRAGGAPQLGATIAILGVLGGLLMPMFLKRSWDRGDRGKL